MKNNIWEDLPKPLYILAPMEDVTDTVFRRVILSAKRPDIFFTEFTSCEGMLSTEGSSIVSHRLEFEQVEHPIIAQIWGKSPEAYLKGAQRVLQLGFDGVDINMGCPVKKIIKQGCCGALINNPTLAKEIIEATKEGAGHLPVSVKTRIGFSNIETESWTTYLLEQNIDALTVHGRTVKQLSKGSNNWNEIGKVVIQKEKMGLSTKIIGNGDLLDLQTSDLVINKFGLDGVMIGRGIFQNPWVFDRNIKKEDITKDMLLEKLVYHLDLYEEKWEGRKDFNIMKKFFKMYVRGFEGAPELRNELMKSSNYKEVRNILKI